MRLGPTSTERGKGFPFVAPFRLTPRRRALRRRSRARERKAMEGAERQRTGGKHPWRTSEIRKRYEKQTTKEEQLNALVSGRNAPHKRVFCAPPPPQPPHTGTRLMRGQLRQPAQQRRLLPACNSSSTPYWKTSGVAWVRVVVLCSAKLAGRGC